VVAQRECGGWLSGDVVAQRGFGGSEGIWCLSGGCGGSAWGCGGSLVNATADFMHFMSQMTLGSGTIFTVQTQNLKRLSL
jgi:hypothetical protein